MFSTNWDYFHTKNIMKGRYKRRQANIPCYSKGHAPLHKPQPRSAAEKGKQVHRLIKRCDKDIHNHILSHTEHGLLVCRDDSGKIVKAGLPQDEASHSVDETSLRPISQEDISTGKVNNDDTYALLHRGKTCDLWNKAIRSHTTFRRHCTGDLRWDEDNCTKWGLAWAMALKCNKCGFRSPKEKLYTEVQSDSPGRRAATINTGLQVGLSKQGMSNSGLVEVIAAANIVPPSASSMQRAANAVGEKIIEANDRDMSAIRDRLKDLNRSIGLPSHAPIPAEADATYNNKLFSGIGNTPYQAGTQATLIVAEGVTKRKQIIATKTYSKLCNCSTGYAAEPHDESCSANLRIDSSIGNEGRYLTDAVEDINSSGLQIGYLTIDGDSSSRSAALDIEQCHGAIIKPQYCTRHLTRNMERHFRKATYSKDMFPGSTKALREQAHNLFTYDLGDRVNAEFNAAHKALHGNPEQMKLQMPHIIDAIVDCYRGDCRECTQYSYVCSESHPWSRPYLDVNHVYKRLRGFINPDMEDMKKLREAIQIRLSAPAVDKTITNSTQNKCEASNRGIKKAVPGSLTFKRNYHARVHSAVHSINNNPGHSILKLCEEVGAPVAHNSSVTTKLKQMDKILTKDKLRKQTVAYKLARRHTRQLRYKMYHSKKMEEAGYNKDGVKESLIEPALFIPPRRLPGHLNEHDYMTRSVTVRRPINT